MGHKASLPSPPEVITRQCLRNNVDKSLQLRLPKQIITLTCNGWPILFPCIHTQTVAVQYEHGSEDDVSPVTATCTVVIGLVALVVIIMVISAVVVTAIRVKNTCSLLATTQPDQGTKES